MVDGHEQRSGHRPPKRHHAVGGGPNECARGRGDVDTPVTHAVRRGRFLERTDHATDHRPQVGAGRICRRGCELQRHDDREQKPKEFSCNGCHVSLSGTRRSAR
jgi:hypothetical protein